MDRSGYIFIFLLMYTVIWIVSVTVAISGPAEEATQLQVEVEAILGNPVIVTGAERSSKRQAELIQSKIERGHNLYALYEKHDIITSILKNKELYSIQLMIETHMRKGDYLSSHLCGKAIDIRSRNYTLHERLQILEKLNSTLGLQAIYEPSPPHIHIERTEGCK